MSFVTEHRDSEVGRLQAPRIGALFSLALEHLTIQRASRSLWWSFVGLRPQNLEHLHRIERRTASLPRSYRWSAAFGDPQHTLKSTQPPIAPAHSRPRSAPLSGPTGQRNQADPQSSPPLTIGAINQNSASKVTVFRGVPLQLPHPGPSGGATPLAKIARPNVVFRQLVVNRLARRHQHRLQSCHIPAASPQRIFQHGAFEIADDLLKRAFAHE